MKKNLRKNYVLIAVCTIICIGFSYKPYSSVYKINDSKNNDMKISGTSTLHNWTMDTKAFTGEAKFVFTSGNDEELTSLTSLSFSLLALNLKSGENGLDKNAYKALKTSQYKNIIYALTSATVAVVKDNKYLIKSEGNLTIAGVTKPVTMDISCIVNKDATITCTGSDKLKMSDYNIKRPTFMMGMMKTGDAITLNFTLVYSK